MENNSRNERSYLDISRSVTNKLQKVSSIINQDQEPDLMNVLNSCILELKAILSANRTLPDFLKEPIPTISQNDSLEIAVKLCHVTELANRIAKLDVIRKNRLSRQYYNIKVMAIGILSKLKDIPEITHKGSGVDMSSGQSTYSLQFGEKCEDYKKYAVVSWHLGLDSASPNRHLAYPEDPKYKKYNGELVTSYNPYDREISNMGMQDRYNEVGIIVLNNMLKVRKKEQMLQRFGEMQTEIKEGILANYGKGASDKVKAIAQYCKGDSPKEKYENVELTYSMLKSLNFGEGMEFSKLDATISSKFDALYSFSDLYEDQSPRVMSVGYQILDCLEKNGVGNFERGMEIVEKINDSIFKKEAKLGTVKAFVEELVVGFSDEEFSKCGMDKSDIIEEAIRFVSQGVADKQIGTQDFKNRDSITSLMNTIKVEIKGRIERLGHTENEDKFSADEILSYTAEKNCDRQDILKVVDELLVFTGEKKQEPKEKESAERTDGKIAGKGIADLRQRAKEGEFVGGGRY